MKRRPIRSIWLVANYCFVGLAIGAEPDAAGTEPSVEPWEVRSGVAILATPVAPEDGSGNNVFFQTGDAAQQATRELRDKLEDPARRAAFRMEQRAALEQLHADIEQELGLDAGTKNKLMDLLADGQLAALESSFMMQPDHMVAMQEQADAETQKLAALRELLGQEGLEKFQFYLSTTGERQQVKRFEALLPSTEKLTPEQQRKLVQLFLEKNERAREQDFRAHLSRGSFGPREGWSSPEELQRQSQLLTIEANEAGLRLRLEENPTLEARAAEFLSPAQLAAFQRMNQDDVNGLRQWIEQARLQAGLSPHVSATPSPPLVPKAPPRQPIEGELTFEFNVTVNRSAPVTHTHTGPNAQPILFEAAEGLWVEATPTLYVDDWLDVQLSFYEQVDNQKRRISTVSSFGTLSRLPDGTASRGAMGTDVVTGSKGYAVKTLVKVRRP